MLLGRTKWRWINERFNFHRAKFTILESISQVQSCSCISTLQAKHVNITCAKCYANKVKQRKVRDLLVKICWGVISTVAIMAVKRTHSALEMKMWVDIRSPMWSSYSKHPAHRPSQHSQPHWSPCRCIDQRLTPALEGSSGSGLALHTELGGWTGWPLRFGTRWWRGGAPHGLHTPGSPPWPAGQWPLWWSYLLWWWGALEQSYNNITFLNLVMWTYLYWYTTLCTQHLAVLGLP